MRMPFLLVSTATLSLHAIVPMSSVVPPDKPYYTKDVRNTQLIYTKNNLPYAGEAAEVQMVLRPL